MNQLLTKSYDAMWPDRARGKQLAFKWLGESRFTELVQESKPSFQSQDDIDRLVISLNELKKTLEKSFSDGSPFPSFLLSTAQKWQKLSLQEKNTVSGTITSAVGTPGSQTKNQPAVPTPASHRDENQKIETSSETSKQPEPLPSEPVIANPLPTQPKDSAPLPVPVPSTEIKTVQDALNECRKYSVLLTEFDTTKPWIYKINRTLRWDVIETIPKAQNSITYIEPPSSSSIAHYKSLLEKNEWKKAITTGEKLLSNPGFQFWFDLQRFQVICCESLGSSYDAVQSMIKREIGTFLQRIPQLIDFCFVDQTPFCDEMTKQWIQSECQNSIHEPGKGSSTTQEPIKESQSWDIQLEKKEVNDLVQSGKYSEAIAHIMHKIESCRKERINFSRSLLLCEILLSAKRPDIAHGILETLHEKINAHNLATWEPDLTVETLSLLYRTNKLLHTSIKSESSMISISERQNSILQRISILDPRHALQLKI